MTAFLHLLLKIRSYEAQKLFKFIESDSHGLLCKVLTYLAPREDSAEIVVLFKRGVSCLS